MWKIRTGTPKNCRSEIRKARFIRMNEIICYTNYLPEGTEQNISFMELLLDDNWANGEIHCPDFVYHEVGAPNTRLTSKQNYEFLLRATKKYPLRAVGVGKDSNTAASKQTTAGTNNSDTNVASFRTDCYVTGKYQQELLDAGYFNPVVETLLATIPKLPEPEEAYSWLEKMISRSEEYYEIDDNTRPILIYMGSDMCCNTLNLFALELANGFLKRKQRVEIFDVEKEGNQALTKYIGQHFKAVIGIQTYVFSIMMQDKTTNLHDLIIGPKFNLFLDHPAWFKDHIASAPKDYYLLSHDRNYTAFANQYYKNIKGCLYFPPGGALPDTKSPLEKQYDITFIGTYRDYRERLKTISSYERSYRFLAARFINIMKKHPDYPAEKALKKALEYYQIELDDHAFLDLFYKMSQCCFVIMLYYREKIIQTLLDAGIEIHVFSETWKQAPFADHKCLICHSELDARKSLTIMQQSRLSLNIMSWHKDGLTERVLNAMLCQSVVLSDKSTTLEQDFMDGKDLILFDLTKLEELPSLVNNLLSDHEKLQQIALSGYRKAKQNHLWEHRAEQLLKKIDAD